MLLTHDQIELRELIQDFALNEILPHSEKLEQSDSLNDSIIEGLNNLGCFNLNVSEEYGGLGLGLTETALAIQEISFGCPAIAQVVLSNALSLFLIDHFAQNKVEFFENYNNSLLGIDGSLIKLSNIKDIINKTTLKVDNDILNGSITRLFNSDRGQYFITSISSNNSNNTLDLAIIARQDLEIESQNNLSFGKKMHKTQSAHVNNKKIIDNNLLPNLTQDNLNEFNSVKYLLYGNIILGALRRCLFEAKNYANQRIAFGKTIIHNQGVSFMLSEIARQISVGQTMSENLSLALEKKTPLNDLDKKIISFLLYSAENCAQDAVQVLGGYGYCKEYKVEKLLRDIKTTILELPSKQFINNQIGEKFLVHA